MPVASERTVRPQSGELVTERKLFLITDEDLPQANPRFQRELNVLVECVGLILCLPLFLVLAMLVNISSPGPVFYKQLRVGVDRRGSRPGGNGRRKVDYGGRLFTIYKFRTMVTQDGPARQVWASKADPRITKIGAV